ncbi:hypothetical protein HRG84_07690 [Flavisolibacter sp. BT320]|nr:hypothetical protein [Flavisolibacter longurius]
MTKEEILKAFAAAESFGEKTRLSPEQIARIRFSEKSSSKLVEVIKLGIDGVVNEDSEQLVGRKIHSFLNK